MTFKETLLFRFCEIFAIEYKKDCLYFFILKLPFILFILLLSIPFVIIVDALYAASRIGEK